MKKFLKLSAAALLAAVGLTVVSPLRPSWATTLVTAHAVSTWPYTLMTLLSSTTLTSAATETHSGSVTFTGASTFAGGTSLLLPLPTTQTVAAGDTIVANACGGIKKISSAGVVSSSTTIPITTPAAANTGCAMDIVNVGGSSITIKYLAGLGGFNSAVGADVVLGSSDTARVLSTGVSWFQVGKTGDN